MKIALGSVRKAKIEAVRASIARIAEVDNRWSEAEIIALEVESGVPAMPLTDEQLMRGARERAMGALALLSERDDSAHLSIGLEGGFHTIELDDERRTFLRGWAYVTDGTRGSFGAGPSIAVPDSIVASVVEGRRELGIVIDEVAGEHDVRSRQGAWGVFSLDLLTRSMSFEAALIAALAPFYNAKLYETVDGFK